jgi:ribonuclease D
VELPPSKQRDDWSRRPLSEAQCRYAEADVLHLFALKRRLTEELVRVGRLAWVEEECAALAAQPAAERVPDPNAFATLKGARDLAPRNLAVLRELYELREALARTLDRPPFKIFGEETLVRLAQAPPADSAGLEGIPGCTPRVIARWGDTILSAIARAGALPEASLPTLERHPRPRIPAVVARRIEALREWRKQAAPRFGLEPGLLLPNRLIGVVAAAGPRDPAALASLDGVRRWRAEAFGAEIVAVLAAP